MPARRNLIDQGRQLAKAAEADPAALPAAPGPAAAPLTAPGGKPDAPAAATRTAAARSARRRSTARGAGTRSAAEAAAKLPPTEEEIAATTPPEVAAPELYPVSLARDEPLYPIGVKVRWSRHRGLKLLAAARGITMQEALEQALDAYFAAEKFTPPDYFRQPG